MNADEPSAGTTPLPARYRADRRLERGRDFLVGHLLDVAEQDHLLMVRGNLLQGEEQSKRVEKTVWPTQAHQISTKSGANRTSPSIEYCSCSGPATWLTAATKIRSKNSSSQVTLRAASPPATDRKRSVTTKRFTCTVDLLRAGCPAD